MPKNLIIWNSERQNWREVRPIDTAHFRFLPLDAAMIDDLNRRAAASARQALQAEMAAQQQPAWPVQDWEEAVDY